MCIRDSRPTIDGRQGGVRESLEDKTMNLAKAVAELISSNLKNGDGSPVECVIADSTIGRVAESAACAEKFEREGVGATITVTSCWCYGSETMDMHPHWPKAVWGFNGTERPGAVYLAAVLAGHAQKGLPAFGIYGHDVQDLDDNTIPADVEEKLLRFARAAMAVANMRGKSYLSFGSVCMGICLLYTSADTCFIIICRTNSNRHMSSVTMRDQNCIIIYKIITIYIIYIPIAIIIYTILWYLTRIRP